jgi:ATPase subunit of ABC transporter with duplicated ATPase domains
MLILDEVTTHLDSDTIIALVDALREFEGALVLITHDRFFMRAVIEGENIGEDNEDSGSEEGSNSEQMRQGRVYRLLKGELKLMDGGMEQYEESISRRLANEPAV